ncbi:hypothetical protein [Leifsonia sp. NPDC058248]|uniref:hypothetical protein n=1 Tax=Leifsonia sp. NPDC058248 TaxID=3346402 RepID=UPI0036D8652D
MSTTTPLLIDLAGVARLAGVRRPVASVWRARFASTDDPFPGVVEKRGGRALFDATSVAQWLARTDHGNNQEAVADAAAAAAPSDFDFSNSAHVAGVDALLALRAGSGRPFGDASIDELARRAVLIDPDDECLATEVSTSRESWPMWADLLTDAAYSPTGASQLLERRHRATQPSAGSAGPLTADAEALLVALGRALSAGRRPELVANAGVAPSLISELVAELGDDIEVSSSSDGRGIRRRLLCDGVLVPISHDASDTPRLCIKRLPSGSVVSTTEILHAVDEVALEMRDDDRAIVIAPAAALVSPVALSDALTRTDVLRSGRVRAIVKLPAGLVTSAPREPLALWILGREADDIPVADRFTAVADLTDVRLTPATRIDLTNDVLAALGSGGDVRSHAFRFARLMRTTALQATRESLVSSATAPSAPTRSAKDLPALLDHAIVNLGQDAPQARPAAGPAPTMPPARVEELLEMRHLRILAGTRVESEELSESGLVVVAAEDLDAPARIGSRRIDPLAFAAGHPSARLTVAGDVVFRTAPTAKAWVDPDGSKIVAYPARVLRIDGSNPGGLVLELVVADINRSIGGPSSWRRWRLRRLAASVAGPLREALSDLTTRREALVRRIAALDSYTELLTDAVVAGAVTLPHHAADAAPEN